MLADRPKFVSHHNNKDSTVVRILGLTSLTIRAKGAATDLEDSSDAVVMAADAILAAWRSRLENVKLL
jgi:hypothetical protein